MSNDTPIITQWKNIKSNYEKELVLFRLGDFYELFYNDAKKAAQLLNITLTKKKSKNQEVPMSGIPYHAANDYINKLLSFGESVVICEQIVDNNNKNIMNRFVDRVLTPASVIEEEFLQNKLFNFLSTIIISDDYKKAAIVYVDISRGYLEIEEFSLLDLENIISRVNPTEIIFQYKHKEYIDKNFEKIIKKYNISYSNIEENIEEAKNNLLYHFDIHSLYTYDINNYNNSIIGASFLIDYLKSKNNITLNNIRKINIYNKKEFLFLDKSSRNSLEINYSDLDKKNSLISVLNIAITKMGKRKISQWINNPLQDITEINKRLNIVEELNHLDLDKIKYLLNDIDDIERITNRIMLNRSNPKEIINLKNFLLKEKDFIEFSKTLKNNTLEILNSGNFTDIINLIDRAFIKEQPVNYKEGFFINPDFNEDIKEYYELMNSSSDLILKMELEEKNKTGLSFLKICYNNINGYFIEISKNKSKNFKVPEHFIFKQNLKNCDRYTTESLIELDLKISNAKSKIIEIEKKLLIEIQEKINLKINNILYLTDYISSLDSYISISVLSKKFNLTKPIISDKFNIINGRHLVIENLFNNFTPNNFKSEDEKMFIITGANMGGKSTYMRQNAIITLMAHSGFFVPAEYAEIPLIDKIYTRIGASDNISEGLSTFMVEMTETANILNNATSKSLIILDEVGRGTSTEDGIALAMSIVDYILSNNQSYTLFSTHYFELNKLFNNKGIKHLFLEIIQDKNNLIFTHKVKEGFVNNSYGIQVAKMAGIPEKVIQKANEYIEKINNKKNNLCYDDFITEIKSIDLNNLKPIEALNLIYKIREDIKNEEI